MQYLVEKNRQIGVKKIMSTDKRYFSWRIGLALLMAGLITLLLLGMILWWFFSIGQSWLASYGLEFLVLPAVVVILVGIGFFWFWTFTSLMILLGAESE